MSLKNPYPVSCPSCGQGFEAVLWDSVNTSVSPEAIELLAEGEFRLKKERTQSIEYMSRHSQNRRLKLGYAGDSL